MPYLVGVVLAVAVAIFARLVKLDRDRAFYPTVMIVIALLYGLFGVIGGSDRALAAESVFILAFVAASVVGFKRNLWIVAAALFAHGVFDFFHGLVISNPGVPLWWPMFCGTYDVVAAVVLGWLLQSSRIGAKPV
ncbi:MAG: hypothetical protein JSS81_05535 [Acidobacteria bacterium]|nr:hypothetical protein [Acidobacteriota bacterium]